MSGQGMGASITRKEDRRFLLGKGRYTDDIVLPGQTWAVFVRSPHAHAKIRKIDASRALAAPGVVAVLTGEDVRKDDLGTMQMALKRKRPDGSPMFASPHRGLTADRLRKQLDHVAAVNAALPKGFRILTGIEVDILADGSLDYDDQTLALLDVVVGSPHNALSQEPEIATKRLVRAIESGKVHIVGHPTGRLINRRAGLSPDMAKIIAAAKANDVALEINSHWMRLDLRDVHVRAAVEGNDAGLVDHLIDDRDVRRSLEDLRAVVVDDGQHRAREAARDAAVVVATIGIRIRGPAALAIRAQGSLALQRLRRERRHPPVRRVDDQ